MCESLRPLVDSWSCGDAERRWLSAVSCWLCHAAALSTLVLTLLHVPTSASAQAAKRSLSGGAEPSVTISDASGSASQSASSQPNSKPTKPQVFDIDEYRVEGADALPQIEVEEAVYPFLGPKRTPEDVEKARAALEKHYHDKGLQAVNVTIPQQDPHGGFIVLKVTENRVGRVRVMGSRYFDTAPIKKKASSVAEGSVPNFNAVTKDIVALNQWPDRRVTPALRAGTTPGTVDVDLNVEDKLPLHGSVELNNWQSPNTTPLRVSATVHYDNLWQLGHSASFTYQIAPLRPTDAEVFSGSYLARLPDNDFVSLLLYGVKSNSDVATVGGLNVVGPGEIVGTRAVITLPTLESFFHTLSIGADYKHFAQTVGSSGATGFSTPVTYFPVVASYTATRQAEGALTQLVASTTFGLRGLGSDPNEFDAKRYKATANFIHFNADLSHTQDLPEGFQAYGRIVGQISDQPLVSSEQLSVGGHDTVRGYLESEVLGDNGVIGTVELRSPNVGTPLQELLKDDTGTPAKINVFNEWRFFGFLDAASVMIHDPLSEQQSHFSPWSFGAGTRLKLTDYFNGSVTLGVPMVSEAYTKAKDPRVSFRVWGEF